MNGNIMRMELLPLFIAIFFVVGCKDAKEDVKPKQVQDDIQGTWVLTESITIYFDKSNKELHKIIDLDDEYTELDFTRNIVRIKDGTGDITPANYIVEEAFNETHITLTAADGSSGDFEIPSFSNSEMIWEMAESGPTSYPTYSGPDTDGDGEGDVVENHDAERSIWRLTFTKK